MLNEKLKDYSIILASASPRRQQFFRELGLDFEIRLKPIKEEYPPHLRHFEITDYLSRLKAIPFLDTLKINEVLITSDTIVWFNETALGKPRNNIEAFNMIASMSGKTHEVITSVSIQIKNHQKTVNAATKVTFKTFTEDEIWYYINNFSTKDKAGAYGIQEWIGQIGVTKIEGSYFNVMGLPVHLVYKTLNKIAEGP